MVGEAGEGRDGVRGIAATKPDVAIVDLKMPGCPARGDPRDLAASPRTGVIVFTMYDNASYVHEAMHAGRRGYVLKSATKEDLLRAVRAVHAGAGFLQAEVTKPLLRRLAADAALAGGGTRRSALREIEVLELLAEGNSNKAIGTAPDDLGGDREDPSEAALREARRRRPRPGGRDRAPPAID